MHAVKYLEGNIVGFQNINRKTAKPFGKVFTQEEVGNAFAQNAEQSQFKNNS